MRHLLLVIVMSSLAMASAAGQQPQAARSVTVTAIADVIAAGVQWQVAWEGTDNADGLVATEDGGVLFAQEQPRRVSKLDVNDKVSIVVENTHGAGALALDARGRILAVERTCTDPGLNAPCNEPTRVAIVHPEHERKVLADRIDGKPFGRLNDLVVDRQGGVYFTAGGAYYVSPAGQVRVVGEDLRTNGVVLSPDEKTLYVTNGPVVVAFDVGHDGAVGNRRDFAKLEAGGSGDGMAVDAAGRLYVTSQPGVQLFSVQGHYLGLIPTPRNAISVVFSGPAKKTMYIVGSGALDAQGNEVATPPGVRNNAKTIFKIPMLAVGLAGRAR